MRAIAERTYEETQVPRSQVLRLVVGWPLGRRGETSIGGRDGRLVAISIAKAEVPEVPVSNSDLVP